MTPVFFQITTIEEPSDSHKPHSSCPLRPAPKEIPRVIPTEKSIVYAQSRTLLHFWMKAEIQQIIPQDKGKSVN